MGENEWLQALADKYLVPANVAGYEDYFFDEINSFVYDIVAPNMYGEKFRGTNVSRQAQAYLGSDQVYRRVSQMLRGGYSFQSYQLDWFLERHGSRIVEEYFNDRRIPVMTDNDLNTALALT